MRKIVIGTRRSNLALTQTNWVREQLEKLELPFEFEIKEIVTKGDRILDVMLSKVGGKGLFVKEIEQAMLNGEIDMAVHSMKDMPAELPEGLIIGCIPEREDPRDVLVSKGNVKLADLPAGSIIGTSSLRRSAQILAVRPDIEIKWIRGNIETRLSKLENEDYDAIILAAAGLYRLGDKEDLITEYLEPEICLPAIGQGALAIECREDDKELLEQLSKLTSVDTKRAVEAERVFLDKMDGSCQVPIAGFAKVVNDNIEFTSLIASPDGQTVYKEKVIGKSPLAVGEKAAEILTAQGAKALIDQVKEDLDQ
ncbi:hydroxymethylbilane synthase [Pseudogracilibacillus auburnensis]|uniref:hydroxymethylbilane synthase n=1 Tax=Pseudogracilibacillus auburnensis TaxID=1494959 RepID=UPI001A9589A9|nr:hydroxymethylbilane synthase [Pseudogracilibacillus auburnensis]MBO1005582.1 hydroxymethylbilane synthase [Pseudogracilibacillus auburnensis]